MTRARTIAALLVAAVVLTLLYGPLALAVLAVVLAATYVARFYAPLPSELAPLRLPRWRRRGYEGELRRRRADLEWALRDARQSDAVLRPELTRTAEALVRGRTERGLEDDPAAARQLLGDDLWHYLASRRGPSPTAAQLDTMLRRLEALQ